MKGSFKLQDKQQQQKENPEVTPAACHICKKVIAGAYGQTWLGGRTVWSCGRQCEQKIHQLKIGENDELFAKNIC